jgi:hypothetical protein
MALYFDNERTGPQLGAGPPLICVMATSPPSMR